MLDELTFAKRMTNLGKTPDYDNVIAFFEIYGAGVVASSEPPHEAYAVSINGNRLAIRGFELHISVHRDPSLQKVAPILFDQSICDWSAASGQRFAPLNKVSREMAN